MKKILAGCVACLAVLAFSATALLAAGQYKEEYKLSVVVGPKGAWGEGAQTVADLVKEKSGGKINIKCYFAGQLFAGKQTNEFLLLRQGVADFALASTINWSPQVVEMNLFALPFFFDDYKQVDAVKNQRVFYISSALITRAGPRILDGLNALYTALYENKQPEF